MATIGDQMCVFCLQPAASMLDGRKLLCGHVGCFSCIEHACKATKEFECPSCSFKCEIVDANKLEIADYSASIPDGSEQLMCGICSIKPAIVFCVKCQNLLCAMHHKDDDEKAISGGYPVHYHVKTRAYVVNKDLYIRHYCRTHSDKKTVQACSSCLYTFCRSCDANGTCSSTNNLHKLTPLPEVVAQLHIKVNELKASLEERSARCQSLLKDTYKGMESFEKKANQMLDEVDRIMNEQIDQIRLEAVKVKGEITKYMEEFSKTAEENVEKVVKCYGLAKEGFCSLSSTALIASAGHMLESFSMIQEGINTALNTDLSLAQIGRKCLVPTGIFRKLEVKLDFSDLSNIEYNKTARNESDSYNSVRWISEDRLVTASNQGMELRDRELNTISSIRIPNVNDAIRYRNELIVLQRLDGNTKSIQLYSMELVKIRDIVSFSTDCTYYSQIASAADQIMATDSHNKCLHIWTLEGNHVKTISLTGMLNPRGVCCTTDGCVLISDWTQKGSIRKYKLGGDYQLLWQSDELEHPRGISESESGKLYVNKCETKKHSLNQLSRGGQLLKTVTCDHLTGLQDLYGISVMGDCLAAACFNEGIKLFQLTLCT